MMFSEQRGAARGEWLSWPKPLNCITTCNSGLRVLVWCAAISRINPPNAAVSATAYNQGAVAVVLLFSYLS